MKHLLLFIILIQNGYFIILKGTLHHINYPSTPFTGDVYITTKLCFNKITCIDAIIDINDKLTLIASNKAYPQYGIDELTIPNMYDTERGYYIGLGNNKSIQTNIYNTSIQFTSSLNGNDTSLDSFHFLLMNKVTFDMSSLGTHIGILGLGYHSHLGESFSIVNHLYNQNITSNLNMGYVFTSKQNVDIFIGDNHEYNKPSFINSFTFCSISMTSSLATSSMFYCKLETMLYNDHNKNDYVPIKTFNGKIVIFSTKGDRFEAPEEGGEELLQLYKKIAGDNCDIQYNSDINSNYMQCKKDYDVTQFPSIKLKFKDTKGYILVHAKDLFDENGTGLLNVRKFTLGWIFGMRVMKYYDFYVNYELGTVGLRENGIFENEYTKNNNNKMSCILMWCIIIIMNLTCSLMILIYKLISNDLGMNIKL